MNCDRKREEVTADRGQKKGRNLRRGKQEKRKEGKQTNEDDMIKKRG